MCGVGSNNWVFNCAQQALVQAEGLPLRPSGRALMGTNGEAQTAFPPVLLFKLLQASCGVAKFHFKIADLQYCTASLQLQESI